MVIIQTSPLHNVESPLLRNVLKSFLWINVSHRIRIERVNVSIPSFLSASTTKSILLNHPSRRNFCLYPCLFTPPGKSFGLIWSLARKLTQSLCQVTVNVSGQGDLQAIDDGWPFGLDAGLWTGGIVSVRYKLEVSASTWRMNEWMDVLTLDILARRWTTHNIQHHQHPSTTVVTTRRRHVIPLLCLANGLIIIDILYIYIPCRIR